MPAIRNSQSGDVIRIHGACLGDSRTGTVLRQADGANLPALVASGTWQSNATVAGTPVRIADMTLDGNWDLLDCRVASSGQSGIYLENAAFWKLKGNHVYGVGQHAIYAHRCWSTTIADNYIEGFGETGGVDNT
jgi:parallel beta-helix repeat protein